MSKKLMLINADHPEECRAVLLENGIVEDLIVEHASHEQIKGNVYLGVINRVEPAIEAAFVDYGGKKYGFLPFKDVRRESYLPTGERKARMRIQDVLVRGQKILVQVVKEGRDAKGPSLSNNISIPGRFLVLMVGQEANAISRKIEDESERKKLKEIIADFNLPDNMGVIIRTAGVGRTKTELNKDLQMLIKIWDNINEMVQSEKQPPPVLVYREPDMVVRTVRDHFTTEMSEILVDNVSSHRALKDFMRMVMPRFQNRIKLYQETKPLFSKHNVEQQIESIYEKKVPLPSGGSLVFDIAEGMVCIDVNSGRSTSASQLEETAIRTNLEAADEVARQLRLRDLGGLVVIDFIDMFQKKNKTAVERQLKQACKKDKARINISRISKFGLLEMSRQRMSPPVREGVFELCQRCSGTGYVKSHGAMALGALRNIQERLAQGRVKELEAVVSPEVADYILNHKTKFLVGLQEKHNFTLRFSSRPGLKFEEFTYNILERKKEEEGLPEEPRLREEPRKAEDVPPAEKKEEGTAPAPSRSKSQEKRTRSPRKRYTRRKTGTRRPGTGKSRRRPSRPGSRSNASRRFPTAKSGSGRGPDEGESSSVAVEQETTPPASNPPPRDPGSDGAETKTNSTSSVGKTPEENSSERDRKEGPPSPSTLSEEFFA